MFIKSAVETGVVLLALSAASMALLFSVMFFKTVSITLFLTIFFLTYSVYSMDRLSSLEEDRPSHPDRTRFLEENRLPFTISIVLTFIASLVLAAASGWIVALIPIAPLAVMFYSGRLPKITGERFLLRRLFAIKDICIASGWAFLLIVTSIYLDLPLPIGAWLFLSPLLLKLLVMAVAYDFKDINSDRTSGVQTLPVKIGERSTKLVLHSLNAIATVSILLLIHFRLIPILGFIFVPAFVYQLIMIHIVGKDAPAWVYFVYCDLEQFFWLVFLGIGVILIGFH